MCSRIDTETGTVANQVTLGYYPVMRQYRDNRVAAGLPGDGISVDRCIVDQVIELWRAGVRTYGCCCGHHKVKGFINVDPDDYSKAVALGFEPYKFPDDPGRLDTVETRVERLPK